MRHTIKCSQCNETFVGGLEYRKHWEEHHLEYALKLVKDDKLRRAKEKNN